MDERSNKEIARDVLRELATDPLNDSEVRLQAASTLLRFEVSDLPSMEDLVAAVAERVKAEA